MPTNPQPQPNAEGRAGQLDSDSRISRYVANWEGVHGGMQTDEMDDASPTLGDLRALLASLATLREENARLTQELAEMQAQPSAPPQERVSEAVREVLSRCEDFRRNPSASGTANATFEHIAQILTAALAHGQTMSNEIREYDTNGNVINTRTNREYDINGKR